MSFKVGQKVRIAGTEIVLPVGEHQYIGDDENGSVPIMWFKAFGIELEPVEPELPEEPPIGTHISFAQEGGIVFLGDGDGYYRIGSDVIWSWEKVIERFGTEFTVLRDEKEVI